MTTKTPSPPPALKMSRPAPPVTNIVTPSMAKPSKEGEIIAICGREGTGKTSLSAFAPDPLMITVGQETGYQALLRSSKVPAIPHMHLDNWDSLCRSLEALDPSPYKTIHIDCLDGAEMLGAEKVCKEQFDGDKGKYTAFSTGARCLATFEWGRFMNACNHLRSTGAHVLLLVHAKVKTFNEPGTNGYDMYYGNLSNPIYEASYGRIDNWFFLNFKGVETGNGTVQVRNLHTQPSVAWIAKNRLKGIPSVVRMPDDPAKMWATIAQYLPGGAG